MHCTLIIIICLIYYCTYHILLYHLCPTLINYAIFHLDICFRNMQFHFINQEGELNYNTEDSARQLHSAKYINDSYLTKVNERVGQAE